MKSLNSIRFIALALLGLLAPSVSSEETKLGIPIAALPAVISSPGVYVLQQDFDINLQSGAALTIAAENVVIDLNGHTISNTLDAATGAYGIYSLDRANLTVRNGRIKGFNVGVFLNGSDTLSYGHLVEDVRVDRSTSCGIYLFGAHSIVRRCEVIKIGGSSLATNKFNAGIAVTGTGTRTLDNSVSEVSPPGAGSFSSVGIYLRSVDGFVVKNRVSQVNTGLYIASSTAKFRDNMIGAGVAVPVSGGVDAGSTAGIPGGPRRPAPPPASNDPAPPWAPPANYEAWILDQFNASERADQTISGRNADPDGDGITNSQEYANGTNPTDYYNGQAQVLVVISGDNQTGPANTVLPLPFVIKVTDGTGSPLNNAPIAFAVTDGGGLLASSPNGTQSITLQARTAVDGTASVFYLEPPVANVTSHITASAGPAGSSTTATFTTVSTEPIPGTARLWLKADTGVTKDGSNRVSAWASQSGTNNTATQATSANQPLWVDNTLNGKPVLRFSGTQWLGLPALMNGAAAGEIFVVLKGQDMPPAYRALMSFGGGVTSFYPWSDGQIYENFGSNTRYTIGNPSQPLDQYHLYNVSSKSGEWAARINGLVQYATSTNTVFFPSNLLIGRNSSNSNFFGDIAEIIVYDRVLSATERKTVEYYLGGKYPVVAPLPAVPATLRATAAAPSQVSLTWNYELGNVATQFEIDRKIGTGSYATIATVAHATSYLDSSVSGGVTYTYRVRAIRYSGQSPYSNEATVTTPLTGSPLPASDMRLWLKADSGTSNPLTVWRDQSGRGNDAIQTNFANRPLVASDSINGRPTIRFSGTQWLGLPALMNGAAAGEIFVVLKGQDMPPAYRALMSFGGGVTSFYPWSDGQIYENFGSNTRYTIGNPSQPLDQYHVYDVSSKSGEWVARINGLVQYATSTNTVYFPPNLLIGRNSSTSNFFGDIAEIIVYDRVLSATERRTVEYYLGGKYPVIAPLPAVPATLQATAAAASQVSLTWNYDLGNVATQFEIDRKTGTGAYATIATVSHVTSYLDSSVSGGVTYTYRVRARSYGGQSPYSNEASVTTPLSGDPLPTTDMRLWLRADSGTSNPLTVWRDQSGRGNDAIQTNFANRPLVASDSINGRPTIRFSGTQWLGLPGLMNGAAAGEIFVVLKGQDMPASPRALMSFGGGDASFYPWSDGQIYESFGSNTRYTIGNPSQLLDQYHLYDVSSKSGEWIARINGLVHYATSTNTVLFPPNPLIGRNNSATNFVGDIAEIIVYDRVLSEGERRNVLHFLDSQYLIPNLDADNDGLTNSQEAALGTDPRKRDTNGDGISDGVSVRMGIDPLGAGYVWPASPQPPSSTPLSFTLSDPPGAVLLP